MNILVDLSKYNHLLGLDDEDMKTEAAGRSFDANIKLYSDIRFDLVLTNRWINLAACAVGYFGVVVIYVVLFGLTRRVILFMDISMIAFPARVFIKLCQRKSV